MCFDKTGTLTINGMEVFGYIGVKTDHKTNEIKLRNLHNKIENLD